MNPTALPVRLSIAHPLAGPAGAVHGAPRVGARAPLHLVEPAPVPSPAPLPAPLAGRPTAAAAPARDDGLAVAFLDPSVAVAAGREVVARMQEALGAERGRALAEQLFGPEERPRAEAPLPRATVVQVASGLLAGEARAAETLARLPSLWCGALPIDVHALVQHVLREAYLQQTLELRDHAEKVKFHNALRKLLRERLQKARQLKAAWVEAERDLGAGSYHDPNGFACMTLNENGEWVPMLTTAEEAAAAAAAAPGASAGSASGSSAPADAGPQPPPAPEMLLGNLYGEAAPLPDQNFLDMLLSDLERVQKPVGGNVHPDFGDVREYLLKNLDRLLAVVPLMTGEQMRKYLFPVLEHLRSNKVKQRMIMHIFRAMRPEQVLFAIAHGWEEEKLKLEDGKRANFIELARNAATAVAASLGRGLDGFETIYDREHQAKAIEITGPEACRILDEANAENERRAAGYREAMQRYEAERAAWEAEQAAAVEQAAALGQAGAGQSSSVPASAGAPPVGEPRAAHTVEALEGYIEELEEKLATVGEDAQLANVDLQNALQKQQQNLQLLSNISKLLHDTAMAIIRKIGA